VVPIIRTARLELVPFSVGAMRATLERDLQRAAAELGAEVPADLYERLGGLFMLQTALFEHDPNRAEWLARAMVIEERIPVGLAGANLPAGASRPAAAAVEADVTDPVAAPARTRRRMIGSLGFHSAPVDGVVEIGYHVEPGWRREGYATEAVAAMLDWAAGRGIHRIRAAIAPTNAASLAVVRRFGFRQTGSQWDEEDGEELVFMVDWPPSAVPEASPEVDRADAQRAGEATA
jgi:GNAT superfamily N-acetyltransferase